MRNSVEVLPAAPAAALALRREHAPPAQVVQAALAGLLAEVLQTDHVPVDADFFPDLGADSMVMARLCARVRKRNDLPSVGTRRTDSCPTSLSSGEGQETGPRFRTKDSNPLSASST